MSLGEVIVSNEDELKRALTVRGLEYSPLKLIQVRGLSDEDAKALESLALAQHLSAMHRFKLLDGASIAVLVPVSKPLQEVLKTIRTGGFYVNSAFQPGTFAGDLGAILDAYGDPAQCEEAVRWFIERHLGWEQCFGTRVPLRIRDRLDTQWPEIAAPAVKLLFARILRLPVGEVDRLPMRMAAYLVKEFAFSYLITAVGKRRSGGGAPRLEDRIGWEYKVRAVRRIERQLAKGVTLARACELEATTPRTFQRWRQRLRFGANN